MSDTHRNLALALSVKKSARKQYSRPTPMPMEEMEAAPTSIAAAILARKAPQPPPMVDDVMGDNEFLEQPHLDPVPEEPADPTMSRAARIRARMKSQGI